MTDRQGLRPSDERRSEPRKVVPSDDGPTTEAGRRLLALADRIDTFCMFCEGDSRVIRSPNGDWSECLDSIHAAANDVRAEAAAGVVPVVRRDDLLPDSDPEHDLLAAAVRTARAASGRTLRSLADELGVDFTYLSKVEHGRNRPSDDLVARLDDALGAGGVIVAVRDREPCPRCGRAEGLRACPFPTCSHKHHRAEAAAGPHCLGCTGTIDIGVLDQHQPCPGIEADATAGPKPASSTTPQARDEGLDAAWSVLRTTQLGGASGIRITLADHGSGDGYFEPYYPAWRATLTADGIKSIQSDIEGGETPAAALRALAAALADTGAER